MAFTARPTVYNGIPMRSRLEARFAAYLDTDGALDEGMTWTYEPRAYASQQGQYLPDFEVRGEGATRLFVEVKPTIEAAYLTLPRIAIIWRSDPSAWLMVVVDGGLYLLAEGQGSPFRCGQLDWGA